MNNPIFITSNLERKKDFRLQTRLIVIKNSNFFEKTALNGKAELHVQKMLKTYKILSKNKRFENSIKLVKPIKISTNTVRFDFINGESAERALIESILSDNTSASIEIVDKLIKVVDSLPVTEAVDTSVKEIQSIFNNDNIPSKDCSSALIDLNFDNIIIDRNGAWNLIDYEWFFQNPIPKKHLISRALFYFFCHRYNELLSIHSRRIKSIKIADKIYVPQYIFDRYREYFMNFEDIQTVESKFQNYVNGKDLDAPGRVIVFYSKPHIAEMRKAEFGFDNILSKKIELEKLLETSESLNTRLEEDIVRLKNSRAYRLALRLSKVRNFLSKN